MLLLSCMVGGEGVWADGGMVGCEGEEELYTRFESGGSVMGIVVILRVRGHFI